MIAFGPLAWACATLGQCTETADVLISLPWGWEQSRSGAHEFSFLFSPREWGYLLDLTIADELFETWSEDDQTSFLLALSAFYGDDSLHFSFISTYDGDGELHLLVQISGFSDEARVLDSYLALSSESAISIGDFGIVPVFASSPGRGMLRISLYLFICS